MAEDTLEHEANIKIGGESAARTEELGKDYKEPETPLWDVNELRKWSLWRAAIAEFIATTLFVYVGVGAAIGNGRTSPSGVGMLGVAWSFGATIFVLVYSTAGISGGHINPAVTLGLFIGRKLSIIRAFIYMVAQVLGGILGAAFVKALQKTEYQVLRGGTNIVADGFSSGAGLGAEILGTFILVYVVYSATDAKRNARDSHVPVLAPLPIGFAVFVVHLVTIPITGCGINPARSFGPAVVWNHDKAWDDLWIFWVGPFIGATLAAVYYQFVIRALFTCSSFNNIPKRWIFWVGPFIGATLAAAYHQFVIRALPLGEHFLFPTMSGSMAGSGHGTGASRSSV